MKKILALLCAVLMLSTCLVACGKEVIEGGSSSDTSEVADTSETTETSEQDPNQPEHVHSTPSASDLLALTANGTYTCTECGKSGVTVAGAALDYSVSSADTAFNTKLPDGVTGTVQYMCVDGRNYYTDGALKLKTAVEGENRVVTLIAEDGSFYYYVANVYTDIISTAKELFNFTLILRNNISTTGYYALGADIAADSDNYILGDSTSEAGYVYKRWSGAKSLQEQAQRGGGFRGVFDGKGYTISGYTFVLGGMFGDVQQGAVVKNLNVTDAIVGESSYRATGILGNGLYGCTIQNCNFEGTIENKECGMLAYTAGGYTDDAMTTLDPNAKVIIKDVTIRANITHIDRAGMTICDTSYGEVYENVTIYQMGDGNYIRANTYSDTFTGDDAGKIFIGETSVPGVTVKTLPKLYADSNYGTVTKNTIDLTYFGEVENIYTDAEQTTSIWDNGQVDFSGFAIGSVNTVYVKTSNGVIETTLTPVTKLICTHDDLVEFKSKQNATSHQEGYFMLGADIVAPTGGYKLEGGNSKSNPGYVSELEGNTRVYGFQGTFDGNGYSIDGYTFGEGGLFADITGTSSAPAVIKNLTIKNAKLEGDYAVLLGQALHRTSITNCTFDVSNSGNDNQYILGYYVHKIRNSMIDVVINANWTGNSDAILGHKIDGSKDKISNVVINQSGTVTALFAVYGATDGLNAEQMKEHIESVITLNMPSGDAQ